MCLLKSGPEVAHDDEVAVPETIGCMARIIECDTGEFGMLLLRTVGTQRFELLSYRVEGNGLLVGIAEPLPDDIPLEGEQSLAQFGACAEVLERIIEALREREVGRACRSPSPSVSTIRAGSRTASPRCCRSTCERGRS